MASIAHGDLCVNGSSVPAQSAVSELLAAANARLMARRVQLASHSTRVDAGATPSAEILPPHLNWGRASLPHGHNSETHSTARPTILATIFGADVPKTVALSQDAPPATAHSVVNVCDENIVVQPSLLVGMLKQELVAIGRIYLLCRHLDSDGRGWLAIPELRAQLTGKGALLRVCGWRRLRQILQSGNGKFWERDDHDRLWLYGRTRVAANLGVQHFSGDCVTMSLRALCGTMGDLRAAFYAAFHAGRESRPIARATLRELTGVPERTQRVYDVTQQVERVANYTLSAATEASETYFAHGRAAFPFKDKIGKHGQAGTSYVAIRLPNSYQATCHTRIPKKQTRLNKKLRQDLVKYGTRGNSSGSGKRVYFTDGQMAARCVKHSDSAIFMRDRQHGTAVFWIGVGRK